MITRRQAIVGCATCGARLLTGCSEVTAYESTFFCSTPQLTEYDELFDLANPANPFVSLAGRVRLRNSTIESTLTAHPFQLFLPSDAWHIQDGLPSGTDKIRIGVFFLDGSKAQQNWVKEFVKPWTAADGAANIEWVWGNRDKFHIRILFGTDRNETKVGNQAAKTSDKNEPTMWLGDVRDGIDEQRIRQVILHEFGHALGLRHEIQHPENGIKWKKEIVYHDYAKLHWTKNDVDQNIFDVYTKTTYLCRGAEAFDPSSIMMYPVLKRWTKDGWGVEPGSQLSPADLKCVQEKYGIS